MADGKPWSLENFEQALDVWIGRENVSVELSARVLTWVLSRSEDPYQGVRREPDFDNLWFGVVPGTVLSAGTAVVCAYWIEESRHVVRCDSFATLDLPL